MPAAPPAQRLQSTIRNMCETDIDPILRLSMNGQTHGRPTRLLLTRALTDPSTHVLVVHKRDTLAGYALMRLFPDARQAYLNAIAVDRLCRRLGLARRLLQALLAECRVLGITTVLLDVAEANHAAQQLYRSFGFTIAGRRPRAYADGNDAVQMCLALTPATGG